MLLGLVKVKLKNKLKTIAKLLVASRDDVNRCFTPVSMQLLDLGSILVAYNQNQVQYTRLRHDAPPLKTTRTKCNSVLPHLANSYSVQFVRLG